MRRAAIAALLAALAWSTLVRVPLVRHAEAHLDSDLAVDGLTLRDAAEGRWRWHFPGTPQMGIAALAFAWPQAAARGADARSLVSGGVAIHEVMIVSIFAMAWIIYGPEVAAWSLLPLAAGTTGTIWLSGRLTGGHLLAAAWHAGAFALLITCLRKGGWMRVAGLGLWCGLGLWSDRLATFTLLGVAVGGSTGWLAAGRTRRGLIHGLVFIPALALGFAPAEIGRRHDPHDAYGEQLALTTDRGSLIGHARLLALDCLPRLAAGRRLPGLQAEPRTLSPQADGAVAPPERSAVGAIAAILGVGLFAGSFVALAVGRRGEDAAARSARWGLLAASAAVLGGFVVGKNVFNSDNYRYLVLLIVPWSLGAGLVLTRVAATPRGRGVAAVFAASLVVVMALDAALYYGRFGWLGPAAGHGDPTRRWLDAHPEVTHVLGGYWDTYRPTFLANHRVEGVPYPTYPSRFPGWSRGLGPGRGKMAVADGRDPRWPSMLAAAWRAEGRDPADLPRLDIVAIPRP